MKSCYRTNVGQFTDDWTVYFRPKLACALLLQPVSASDSILLDPLFLFRIQSLRIVAHLNGEGKLSCNLCHFSGTVFSKRKILLTVIIAKTVFSIPLNALMNSIIINLLLEKNTRCSSRSLYFFGKSSDKISHVYICSCTKAEKRR